MRAAWILLAIGVGACGDNAEPPRLKVVAAMPAGLSIADVAFDADDVPTLLASGGAVQRFAEAKWRAVPGVVDANDFGSDSDGTLLVMTSRGLFQLDGGVMSPIGGSIGGLGAVAMPMQVPSGNRYVRESTTGGRRSFVLPVGATTWVESPPMFASRPVRAYDKRLFAAAAGGVQRFDADGMRPFAVTCEQLGLGTCTNLVVGGADRERLVVGDSNDVIVVDGTAVERVSLPGGFVPARIAVGDRMTVILARKSGANPVTQPHALFTLDMENTLMRVETDADPPTSTTRFVVDATGFVWVATQSLANVVQ